MQAPIITEINDKEILQQMVENLAQSYNFLYMVQSVNQKNERIKTDCQATMHHLKMSSKNLRELLTHYKGHGKVV